VPSAKRSDGLPFGLQHFYRRLTMLHRLRHTLTVFVSVLIGHLVVYTIGGKGGMTGQSFSS
jgi:hypothetical protein